MRDPKNPYRDSDDHPRLLKSIAAFVDILGYVDLTANAHETGNDASVLRRLRDRFDTSFPHLSISPELWAGVPAPWMVKGFSDNVVVGMPVREHAGLDLYDIAERLGAVQLGFALAGFFVRGGIAVGDLYMDAEMIYGPALAAAHETEQATAINPRIVLHESADQVLEEEFERTRSLHIKMPPYNETFFRDADGRAFINYLSNVTEYEYDHRIYFETLGEHKKSIETKLSENAIHSPILSKYLWSAAYHNFFCEMLEEHAYEANSYRIDVLNYLPGPRSMK